MTWSVPTSFGPHAMRPCMMQVRHANVASLDLLLTPCISAFRKTTCPLRRESGWTSGPKRRQGAYIYDYMQARLPQMIPLDSDSRPLIIIIPPTARRRGHSCGICHQQVQQWLHIGCPGIRAGSDRFIHSLSFMDPPS